MIAYLPIPYGDELLYSVLCRYHKHSGNSIYRGTAENLFLNPRESPSIFLTNTLKVDVMNILLKNQTFEKFVSTHTLINYKTCFRTSSIRTEQIENLKTGVSNIKTHKKNEKIYLKYCPKCVEDERQTAGETYWHTPHQCSDMSICIKHNCFLENGFYVDSSISPNFYDAESIIPENPVPRLNDNPLLLKINQTLENLLLSAPCCDDRTIGQLLSAYLETTKYVSPRGGMRYISSLQNDISLFYKNVPLTDSIDRWKLEHALNGTTINLYDITLILVFFNIDFNTLSSMPDTPTKKEQSDARISELRSQRYSHKQISVELNIPIDTVKTASRNKKKQPHVFPKKKPRTDWNTMDLKVLTAAKALLKQKLTDESGRPIRLTRPRIEQELQLPAGTIRYHLPYTDTFIRNNQESQEEFWAREVTWSVKEILKTGEVLNWKHIRNRTNLRPINLHSALPYISDPDVKSMLESILSELVIKARQ